MKKEKEHKNDNFFIFLGTAGARFVTIAQERSSGGIWLSYEGTNVLIDPGPGSLVRCIDAGLRPDSLDGIILTHKHIDHANDINIMVEAMTSGGRQKKGKVFLPSDMLGKDTIFLSYCRNLPERVVVLKEKGIFQVGSVKFATPLRLRHSVETYGIKFYLKEKLFVIIADTAYFDELIEAYKGDIVVINTVLTHSIEGIGHLSIPEATNIIQRIKPHQVILTHFGRDIVKEGPEKYAQEATKTTGVNVVAAFDGMRISL